MKSRLCCIVLCLSLFSLRPACAAASADLQALSVQRAALQLSRRAITQYLQHKTTLPLPTDLPPALRQRYGVFVTIEKRGQITPRGCRGTLQPAYTNLAEEIIQNSIAACSRDQNQPPLRLTELPSCRISLTVVLRTAPIQNIAQHDPANNGLIAQSGSHIGIVLPYEGHNATTQLRWAKRKAGLSDTGSAHLLELYGVRCRE